MCYPTPTDRFLQQAIPNGCPAKLLGPSQRLTIGLHAVAGCHAITALADDFDVSRKFVYQQATIARTALAQAFAPPDAPDDAVLFYLPVTKAWLHQVVLALLLICHSSYRGVLEFCRDLLGVRVSIGTVHNIVKAAVEQARAHNRRQDLANVDIAGLDEIFQNGQPVLVGADIASTYCFLLTAEAHRDADTWGVRLLELQDQGFAPRATVADFGSGLRAGQELAMPGLPCRGDVFHALYEITPLVTYLENRAYDTIAAHHKLAGKQANAKRQGRSTQGLATKTAAARQTQTNAVTLADDVALLARWLHYDIFAVSGLPYDDRCALFDFILAELQARTPLCPHRLAPACTFLHNHRDQLLAFARQLDQDLAELADQFAVPLFLVRELLDLQTRDQRWPARWQQEAALRQKLHHHFHPLQQAVRAVAANTVRASSVIENFNSRLRGYFFLRRHLGGDYLHLLQFFLNHRRFLRSERPERVDQSPAELLTGVRHPHWLEMLGYTRFSRN